MSEKPLFIPLKTEFFEAFKRGEKRVEYRLYGPRWNKETCRIGRPVTLSKGYGKYERLSGVVRAFYTTYISAMSEGLQDSLLRLYGRKANNAIAAIGIEVIGPSGKENTGPGAEAVDKWRLPPDA